MGSLLLTVRRLCTDDLPQALALTQAQRWSHQAHDWALALRLGCGFGVCDPAGSLLGTALWWANGPRYGTLGLIVVRDDCQGQGIGRRLMDAVLSDCGDRSLGLIATDAGLKLYRDTGFVPKGRIEQWQGTVAAVPAMPKHDAARRGIRSVLAGDLTTLLALDQRALGAPRIELLSQIWLEHRRGWLYERDGVAQAYCLLRPAGAGTTIGPLIAADESMGALLADHALQTVKGIARLDIPADCQQLAAALQRRGLQCVDRVTAMHRGASLDSDPHMRRFGLASQAFG